MCPIPKPIVYFPLATPSNSSSCSSEMHYKRRNQLQKGERADSIATHPLGEVHLHAEDTDVAGSSGDVKVGHFWWNGDYGSG